MKFENLDKLFELYVQEAVRKNKEKYSVAVRKPDGQIEVRRNFAKTAKFSTTFRNALKTISKLPTPFVTRSCARKAQPNT